MFAYLNMILPKDWRRDANTPWSTSPGPNISLNAAGLVALADIRTIALRTALTGTSTFLDTFVLCPGIHSQQAAPELNGGEYPACGAMTSGYVFRVENPATVLYLQKVGVTGQLTTLSVESIQHNASQWDNLISRFFTFQAASFTSSCAYLVAVTMTATALTLLALSQDWWGLTVVLFLCTSRLCNVIVIRRRTNVSWQGAAEPGVKGDLLILLSQDRWIRMKGMVDDLKAVTSGQWLRDMTFLESSVAAFATLLVFLDAALASNVEQAGKMILLVLLIASAGVLGIANETTQMLHMHGRVVKVEGSRTKYRRRLEMAEQLVRESGRDDWAMRMGMIVRKDDEKDSRKDSQEGVTM
ncbi:hypothetical protein GJ744_004830 [Endocarpon pusillum]|uniref:Uncharacterized protein n=1 Tax=Endocarpon pusillum TaxID=364733 RepID=A0A8H7AUB9_9EURO|nr:hypothetical protein GJ744_004830 [Endocarpon pusillum]